MKKLIFLLPIFVLLQLCLYAQVGIGTATPNASAKLEVSSTTQGFLPPRMTQVQRDQILSCPKIGLHKYNVNVYTTRRRSKDFLQSRTKAFDLQRPY